MFGFGACTLALLYYAYQVYNYSVHWYKESDIDETTKCSEIYVLEIWLLTQNILWIVSIVLVLIVLAKPQCYKLLLFFAYLMGPVYFTWSAVAVGYFTAFLTCCKEVDDNCVTYYPASHPSSFTILLGVSLLFSACISLYLIALVGTIAFRWLQTRWQSYQSVE